MGKEAQLIHGVYQPSEFGEEKAKKELLCQGYSAVKAILKREKGKTSKQLFPEQTNGLLIRFRMKKPRTGKITLTKFIKLPNPESAPENTSVCLILPDFKYKEANRHDPDVDKNARKWADILAEKNNLTGKHYSKIYTLIQLQREVSTNEDKRKFTNTYDRILVHQSLHRVVIQHLGRSCRKVGKYPEKINVRSPNLYDAVVEANSKVALIHPPYYQELEVRFGNAGQKFKELKENLKEVVDECTRFLPGGLFNVKLAQILLMNDVALPIYVDFGRLNDVVVKERKAKAEPIVDECSALPDGLKVKVMPSRRVQILSEKDDAKVAYPTVDDEWEKHDDLKPTDNKSMLVRKMVQAKERTGRHRKRRQQRKRLNGKIVKNV
ncbi:hypothetical protein M3Y98_00171200 [Aphelenchoides besseyi]|nr:hypothetical protein M3Y98_00171200 [Aphelenchoides besseyi]KAI6200006.1 hypothetical protein M3Y96_00687700 [Aphelenchoides besseyi]